LIKTLNKLTIKGNLLNVIKVMCGWPTANTTLKGEGLKAFSMKSKARMPAFNVALEVLNRAIGQGTEIKGVQTAKKEVELPLFTDDAILYAENFRFHTNC